ncbi:MAG TPA: DNA primase [Tepidiformaceae bacterium]|nr:DNA primase [Tepidiformaceae bacterium]
MALDVVAEIKSRIDPVEYIGRVARLEKSGRNFKALCPFHTEKTPSFYVFPDRGTWRCFGSCGEGGDIFSFVQKRENVEFREALRQLAAEAGVQLTAESAERRSRAEKLAAIVSAAVEYYQRCLREDGGADARKYLIETRGLTSEAIETFRLGWAPDEWRALRDYLSARGYDEKDALAAGLLVEPESGGAPYDRFRGRVIVPIADERGIFVAMGGRGLHGEEPKYLNSPQTELFDKGRTLFGLDLAGKPIRESGVAVVVEGYMDVIGPWQAGFRNVVATMGTSLTEQHAALLKRYSRRVVLAMDPDAAGLAAAERAGGLFLGLDSPESMARSARSADSIARAAELDIRVAPLPAGHDPDEIARDDPEGWARAIDRAMPYPEFLLRRIMGAERPESPMDARRIVDRLRPVLLTVRDPVERAVYVQRVARHLGITEAAVQERLRQGLSVARRPGDRTGVQGETPSDEDTLLAILLRYPHLRSSFRAVPHSLFTAAVNREVFARWLTAADHPLTDQDPVGLQERRLGERRLPPLSVEGSQRAAESKIRDIIRARVIQHQATVMEAVAAAEKEFGANRVAEATSEAWRGAIPAEDVRNVVEAVMEEYQLGLSLHRHEEFDGRDVVAR